MEKNENESKQPGRLANILVKNSLLNDVQILAAKTNSKNTN